MPKQHLLWSPQLRAIAGGAAATLVACSSGPSPRLDETDTKTNATGAPDFESICNWNVTCPEQPCVADGFEGYVDGYLLYLAEENGVPLAELLEAVRPLRLSEGTLELTMLFEKNWVKAVWYVRLPMATGSDPSGAEMAQIYRNDGVDAPALTAETSVWSWSEVQEAIEECESTTGVTIPLDVSEWCATRVLEGGEIFYEVWAYGGGYDVVKFGFNATGARDSFYCSETTSGGYGN